MYRRKVNGLLFLFSLIGGAAGFAIGEILLYRLEGQMSSVMLMGLYFGILGLLTAGMCLAAETVNPELNGRGWKLRYAGTGWKLLVPAAFVMLLAAGVLFQFIYGLGLGGHKPAENIVLVIDKSSSMLETDPKRESVLAAQQLIDRMDNEKRAGIVLFNEQPELLQPMTELMTQAEKDQVKAALESYQANGQTDISAALQMALDELSSQQAQRKSMIILISDGYSEVNVEMTAEPFRSEGIAIHTVGMNGVNAEAGALLQQLADYTEGSYTSIDQASELSSVFTKIYEQNRDWHLMGERAETTADNLYYVLLRIIFLTIIGALMGLSLGIIFDNRHLAISFTLGGTIAGLIAGLFVESWMKSGFSPIAGRFLADLVLAAVLALSTLIIPVREKNDNHKTPSFNRGGKGPVNGRSYDGSGSFDRR